MIWSAEDIKTEDDKNRYGWEMRLIQIEEDIDMLQKRKKEIQQIYLGLLDKLDEVNQTDR